MKRCFALLVVVGSFLLPAAANAWVPLGSCQLHVGVPTWPGGAALDTSGWINCPSYQHLQVQVCLQKWGVGGWRDWGCGYSRYVYSRSVSRTQRTGTGSGYYRTWDWGFANGWTGTYTSATVNFGPVV